MLAKLFTQKYAQHRIRLQCSYMQQMSSQIRSQVKSFEKIERQIPTLEKDFNEKQYRAYIEDLNNRLDQILSDS